MQSNNNRCINNKIKWYLNIFLETAMGQSINAQTEEHSEYVSAIYRISRLLYERLHMPWYWNDFVYFKVSHGIEYRRNLDIIQDFTRKVIKEREIEYKESNFMNSERKAFLDILLKAKHDDLTLTPQDLQEEVDTFMFEGHDTTTSATSWTCHLIGTHIDIQKKLHEEIDKIFGDSDRAITNEDLHSLEYLECVIKESLRLFPPVPFLSRSTTEDCLIG